MATIAEILIREKQVGNLQKVVMFKEGKFWKAYEMSAFLLAKRYGFRPTKRMVKAVGQEIISIGFPDAQLAKYLPNAVMMDNSTEIHADVRDARDERAFLDWKQGVPVKEKKEPIQPVEKIPKPDELKFDPYAELPRNYYCDELPVFRHTAMVLEYIQPQLHHLDRDYRYSIGSDITHSLISAERNIMRAWRSRDRIERMNYIDRTEECLLDTKLYIRLLHEVKQLTVKQFAVVSEKLVLAERHLANWKKNTTGE
ncbi:MAG: four helix bundle protein [Paludibacteraceae bacterium]|nr:four helix bundle protein [Paludibacteraceae bacterium]